MTEQTVSAYERTIGLRYLCAGSLRRECLSRTPSPAASGWVRAMTCFTSWRRSMGTIIWLSQFNHGVDRFYPLGSCNEA
jgi:hypothetical protein